MTSIIHGRHIDPTFKRVLVLSRVQSSILLVALLLTAIVYSPSLQAVPGNGIAVMSGYVEHHYSLTQQTGANLEFQGRGIGLGADMQFVVNDQWSINTALQWSLERTTNIFNVSGNTEGTVFTYNAIFQVRHWFDNLYLCPQIGIYHETFHSHAGQIFTRRNAGGGFALGWEAENGWLINLQYDLETPSPIVSDQIQVVRIFVGYRWK